MTALTVPVYCGLSATSGAGKQLRRRLAVSGLEGPLLAAAIAAAGVA